MRSLLVKLEPFRSFSICCASLGAARTQEPASLLQPVVSGRFRDSAGHRRRSREATMPPRHPGCTLLAARISLLAPYAASARLGGLLQASIRRARTCPEVPGPLQLPRRHLQRKPVPIKNLRPQPYGCRPKLPTEQVATAERYSGRRTGDQGSPVSLLRQSEGLNRDRRERHNPPAPLRLGGVEHTLVYRLPNT